MTRTATIATSCFILTNLLSKYYLNVLLQRALSEISDF
jgi:hypothetical protein